MRSILFLFFLLIVSSAKSQIAQNWKNGYYYSSSGEKVSGSINYKAYNNAFKFRSATGEEVSIKITQVKAVVIPDEADSVTVLTEGGNERKKYFAKVAGASPTTKFYYKLKAQRKGGVTIHADDNTASLETPERPYFTMKNTNFSEDPKYVAVERVLMYEKDNTTFEVTKSNFKEVLGNAFSDDAELSAQIKSGKYKFTDLVTIIGTYQLFQNAK